MGTGYHGVLLHYLWYPRYYLHLFITLSLLTIPTIQNGIILVQIPTLHDISPYVHWTQALLCVRATRQRKFYQDKALTHDYPICSLDVTNTHNMPREHIRVSHRTLVARHRHVQHVLHDELQYRFRRQPQENTQESHRCPWRGAKSHDYLAWTRSSLWMMLEKFVKFLSRICTIAKQYPTVSCRHNT